MKKSSLKEYNVYDTFLSEPNGDPYTRKVGSVFARNKKEALHKAKTEFSSISSIDLKSKVDDYRNYDQAGRFKRKHRSRFERGEWMESETIPGFLK